MDGSESKDAEALAKEMQEGPLSLLYDSAKKGTPVMVCCRNNRKLIGRIKAFDRHFNMVLEGVTEIWTVPGVKGKGQKKAAEVNKERRIPKMFLRGDGVVLVVRNPQPGSLGLRGKSTCAVALDVDGVLLRGPKALPGAKEALERLDAAKIPFLLLTNGGGYLEGDKAAQIGKVIGYPLTAEHMQVAHTPYKALAPSYADKPVLLVGKSRVHRIAKSYGFTNTYDISDLHHQWPALFPDWKPAPKTQEFEGVPAEPKVLKDPLSLVLVMMDPLHYHRDMQILIDVIRSTGIPSEPLLTSTSSSTSSSTSPATPKQVVPVYFAGLDLEYVTEHPVPRFGSGIFHDLVSFFYSRVTGAHMEATLYGKPFPATYKYANATLAAKAAVTAGASSVHKVYMIGDNPKSDIRGANASGWHSILVRTGMFQGPLGANDVDDPAKDVVDGVMDAVDRIIELESARSVGAN